MSCRELSRIAGVSKTTAATAMQRFRADLARGHAGRLLLEGRAAQFEHIERFYDDDGKLMRTERVTLEPVEEKIFADDTPIDDRDGTLPS